jgi:hypothetical protein
MFAGWNFASAYWAVWFGVAFLGPELYWVATKPSNTLSAQVWHLENMQPGVPWSFAHLMVLFFTLWLLFHFTFGMFR